MMDDKKRECLEAILALLNEQRTNLQDWPFTPEQLTRDKQISRQLREACDHMSSLRSINREEWENMANGFYLGEPECGAAQWSALVLSL